jgi:hypothetical protein
MACFRGSGLLPFRKPGFLDPVVVELVPDRGGLGLNPIRVNGRELIQRRTDRLSDKLQARKLPNVGKNVG